ncbi:MAG: response regulator transcription factor [Synergistetes bacterium]|nr:response regulator transcription factor [Synergistota bacterium]
MRKTIAVVDDEEDIVELISYNLKREGFDVRGFYDGESFISSLKSFYPDLVILDLLLPGMDGFEVCRYIRRDERLSRIPIIMLSVKDSEIDKVVGLELGADDYLTKPFSTRELIARVKAVLRRYGVAGVNKASLIKRGSLLVDLETMEVTLSGRRIELTPIEFKLLVVFLQNPGRVFTREDLLEKLWGGKFVVDRTVDVHINNLRKKLGEAGKAIKSLRGVGYKLER